MYDNEDGVCGILYNNVPYYFFKNLQGDVIEIIDKNYNVVARYSYDAWGVPTIVSDTSGCSIATINPFRYRGYYYDAEIGMYYLQSRYYDPVVGRFINADDVECLTIGTDILTLDLFTYCENNCINEKDEYGKAVLSLVNKILCGILTGLAKQFLFDYIVWLFKRIVQRKSINFTLSSSGAYIAAAIEGVLDQFTNISDYIRLNMSLYALVLKNFKKVISTKFRSEDWLELIADIARIAITYFLGRSLSKLKTKYAQAKKAYKKNYKNKSLLSRKKELKLSIKYKMISLKFIIPITSQAVNFIAAVLF